MECGIIVILGFIGARGFWAFTQNWMHCLTTPCLPPGAKESGDDTMCYDMQCKLGDSV